MDSSSPSLTVCSHSGSTWMDSVGRPGRPSGTGAGVVALWSNGVIHNLEGVRIRPVFVLVTRVRAIRGPGSIAPTRSFGPGRSIEILMSRPTRALAARTFAAIARQASGVSCAQLIRAMSIPASAKDWARSGSSAASVGRVTITQLGMPSRGSPNRAELLDANCSWERSIAAAKRVMS